MTLARTVSSSRIPASLAGILSRAAIVAGLRVDCDEGLAHP